jgi:uncharacterized protein YukE
VSQAARDAATQFMQIINSGLTDSMQALKRQGDILSDGADWQGALARQFQEIWNPMKGDFDKMITDLDDLVQRVQKILASITEAGGGG